MHCNTLKNKGLILFDNSKNYSDLIFSMKSVRDKQQILLDIFTRRPLSNCYNQCRDRNGQKGTEYFGCCYHEEKKSINININIYFL